MTKRLVAAALVAAGLCAMSIPASADPVPPPRRFIASDTTASPPPTGVKCTPSVPSVGGIACFDPRGDKMWVLDTAYGTNVTVRFFTYTGWSGWCDNYHGVSAGWTVCNLDAFLPERHILRFRVEAQANSAWVETRT